MTYLNRLRPKSLSKKLLLIVCIPLVFQLAATACMTWFASHLVMVAQHQYEAKAIIGCANWLSFEVASAPLFWMVKNLSGDDEYSKQWKLREEGCHKTLQELKEVLQEQPGQAQKVDGLAQVINSFLQTLHTIDQMPDLSPQSKVERLARSPEFKRFFVQYPYLRSSILASHRHAFDVAKVPFIPDQGLPVESRTLQDRSNWLTMGLWEVWILTGILAAAVLVISRGLTRRVAVVTENARLLAADRPLYPAIGGDDEVALLDDTFHSMARAIKEAAEKERAIIRPASDVICSIDPN